MSGTLPRQFTNAQAGQHSIFASNQLRETLETALAAILGKGVLAKGLVTKTAALAVQVETGTVLFAEGVALTLGSAASYSGLTASATNYLWGTITRTARDRGTVSALDTWALVLSHNTTGTPPSDTAIPLATISIPASTILAIDDAPAGKYLQRPGSIRESIAAGSVECVDSGYQVNARGTISVRGTLLVRGHYYVRGEA